MLTIKNLNKAFDSAINEGASYIGVVIVAEGVKECIVIPKKSFEAKQEFYNRAYSDDLTHVMNSEVEIVGFTHGEWTDIEALV